MNDSRVTETSLRQIQNHIVTNGAAESWPRIKMVMYETRAVQQPVARLPVTTSQTAAQPVTKSVASSSPSTAVLPPPTAVLPPQTADVSASSAKLSSTVVGNPTQEEEEPKKKQERQKKLAEQRKQIEDFKPRISTLNTACNALGLQFKPVGLNTKLSNLYLLILPDMLAGNTKGRRYGSKHMGKVTTDLDEIERVINQAKSREVRQDQLNALLSSQLAQLTALQDRIKGLLDVKPISHPALRAAVKQATTTNDSLNDALKRNKEGTPISDAELKYLDRVVQETSDVTGRARLAQKQAATVPSTPLPSRLPAKPATVAVPQIPATATNPTPLLSTQLTELYWLLRLAAAVAAR